jgi:hypothetical protein
MRVTNYLVFSREKNAEAKDLAKAVASCVSAQRMGQYYIGEDVKLKNFKVTEVRFTKNLARAYYTCEAVPEEGADPKHVVQTAVWEACNYAFMEVESYKGFALLPLDNQPGVKSSV